MNWLTIQTIHYGLHTRMREIAGQCVAVRKDVGTMRSVSDMAGQCVWYTCTRCKHYLNYTWTLHELHVPLRINACQCEPFFGHTLGKQCVTYACTVRKQPANTASRSAEMAHTAAMHCVALRGQTSCKCQGGIIRVTIRVWVGSWQFVYLSVNYLTYFHS